MRQFKPIRAEFEKVAAPLEQSFLWRHYRAPLTITHYRFHPEYELIYFASNRGWRIIGDSIEAIRQGELLLLAPRLTHLWLTPRDDNRLDAVFVQFLPGCLGDGFFELPEMRAVKRLLAGAERGLLFSREAAREAHPLLESWKGVDGEARVLRLLQILVLLTGDRRATPLCSEKYRARQSLGHEERIGRVYQFLNEHFGETVRQSAVARNIRMNPAAFSRLFRKTTGKRFVDVLNEIRISHACRLLQETEQTIAEICYACGYQTLSHFNRLFRRLKKKTPRQLRRQLAATVAGNKR